MATHKLRRKCLIISTFLPNIVEIGSNVNAYSIFCDIFAITRKSQALNTEVAYQTTCTKVTYQTTCTEVTYQITSKET